MIMFKNDIIAFVLFLKMTLKHFNDILLILMFYSKYIVKHILQYTLATLILLLLNSIEGQLFNYKRVI